MVISPLHNVGSSVVASMLAQGLTFSNKTSLLTFSDPGSNLPRYLGIENVNDPTRSVMQIVKLIDNGAIEDKDIMDYTFTYSKNAHLLNIADRSLQDRDRIQIINHVYGRSVTDVVIIDNSDDINTRFTGALMEMSDVIFVVVPPSKKAFERLKQWRTYTALADKPNVFVIISQYNEVVNSLRDMAKYIGLPASRVCKLHYNPWIAKCCMIGELHTILPLTMGLDPRVVNIYNDIKEFNSCIDNEIYVAARKET